MVEENKRGTDQHDQQQFGPVGKGGRKQADKGIRLHAPSEEQHADGDQGGEAVAIEALYAEEVEAHAAVMNE